MLGFSVEVENMSHVTSSFSVRPDDDLLHYTQQAKRRIKLMLVFVIPGQPRSEVEDQDPLEQDPEALPRLATIKVPKGVPVWRLRNLVTHCEGELQQVFGKCKRANFVLVTDESSDNWKYEFELPMSGVVYV